MEALPRANALRESEIIAFLSSIYIEMSRNIEYTSQNTTIVPTISELRR